MKTEAEVGVLQAKECQGLLVWRREKFFFLYPCLVLQQSPAGETAHMRKGNNRSLLTQAWHIHTGVFGEK